MSRARRTIAAISAAATFTLALVTLSDATTSSAVAAIGCGTSPSTTYKKCLFHDSFAGTTLKAANWTKADGYLLPASGACLAAANVNVGGGTLNLKSEVLAAATNCVTNNPDTATRFVGASVTTDGKFARTYGRIEFRAKFASDTFAHTALWMNPTNLTYGPWPKSGEIDVMERFAGYPNIAVQSIHYEGQANHTGNCTIASPGVFHRYGVEWSSSRIKFYIDNKLCHSFGWTPTNVDPPAPFDHPFNLIATQVAGGDANTPAGNVRITKVDWVKYWG